MGIDDLRQTLARAADHDYLEAAAEVVKWSRSRSCGGAGWCYKR